MDKEKKEKVGNLFREALYTGNSIPEIESIFGEKIADSFPNNDIILQQFAIQLMNTAKLRKSPYAFSDIATKICNSFYGIVENNHPELLFVITGREKALVSEIHKRFSKIEEGLSPMIKDVLAIRIIILNPTNQKILRNCYEIAQEIIEVSSLKNNDLDFDLELSNPDKIITSSSFSSKKYPEVIIPDDNIVIPEIQTISKNYIKYPKDKGYQSIHITFQIPSTSTKYAGIFLEVQIRTIFQHKWAEYGPANHTGYKRDRKAKMDEIFFFDKKQVHIPGYDENFDFPGLESSIPLYQRQKTF